MKKLFITFFGVGLLKPAPGTWGSIAGAIVALPILYFLNQTILFLLSFLLFVVSIKIIDSYEKQSKIHDASYIVIDEVAGVWFALSICCDLWLGFILSVILFRFFDITKISIIGRVDKNVKGGLGVMLDDMIAGGFAGFFGLAILQILKKFNLDFLIF